MKKLVFLLITIAVVITATFPVLAHSGRTDENGGHLNHATGEYHYHHGYPAHQHENGVCPYDFDDKTGQYSGGSGSSNSKYANNSNADTTKYILAGIACTGVIVWFAIRRKRNKSKNIKSLHSVQRNVPIKVHQSTAETHPIAPTPKSDEIKIKMYPVESSNIHSIGYVKDILVVRFRDSGIYAYKGVSQHLFNGLLLKNQSCGKFFNAYVRDHYYYECISSVCSCCQDEEGEYIAIKK